MDETTSATLDGHRKACLLVGQFMWRWGALEAAANRAYRKLLKIKGIEGYIATANISFRDKLSAVRTVVHWVCKSDVKWWTAADKDLLAISEMNGSRRNIVAHNAFMEHPSGGVEFIIIRAKGKFAIPDVVWTPDEFSEVFEDIERLHVRLDAIVEHVEHVRSGPSKIAQAFNIFAMPPTPEPPALDDLPNPARHLPAHDGDPSPNPTEVGETPQAPPPKPKSSKRKK